MRIIIIAIALLISLAQCSSSDDVVFSQKVNFEEDSWPRFKKLDFEIPVEHPGSHYNLFFTLHYSSQFPHDNIPLHAILKTPGGEERIYEFTIEVRDNTGKEMGKKPEGSSYYYLEAPLWQGVSLKEGEAFLSLEQIIPKYSTPGISKAGIRIYEAG
jgi:gliding motility-associated lipoprotein GldH